MSYKKYSCWKCNSILYEADGDVDTEVLCHDCRAMNYPFREDLGIGLRGKSFQMVCIDHRCDNCGRLLLRSNGFGKIRMICPYKDCKHTTIHDTNLIRQGRFKFQRTERYVETKKTLAR